MIRKRQNPIRPGLTMFDMLFFLNAKYPINGKLTTIQNKQKNKTLFPIETSERFWTYPVQECGVTSAPYTTPEKNNNEETAAQYHQVICRQYIHVQQTNTPKKNKMLTVGVLHIW